jgi:hypothetical protein
MVGTVSDVDGTNRYQPPPGGGELIGNANPADNLSLQDTLLGWQPGKPQGFRTRGFTLAQILDELLVSIGGPYVPAAGGALTGPLTGNGLGASAFTATGSTTARTLADRAASVANVLDFGPGGAAVDRTGVTDVTAAIQAAAAAIPSTGGTLYFPAGTYLVSSPIRLHSNTRACGDGPGSLVIAASSAAWVDTGHVGADPYCIFTNLNYGTFPVADHDITVSDLAMSWVNHNTGDVHSVRFFAARAVKVLRCVSSFGGDHTAFLGVIDGVMEGNTTYNVLNCPYDCWHGSTDIRIINNYALCDDTAQLVNFNAAGGASGGDPQTASRAVISGNTLINLGLSGHLGTINLSTLGAAGVNTVSDVTVSNNLIVGGIINGRGDIRDVQVFGNKMLGVLASSAIGFTTDTSVAPQNINVIGNTIVDPQTVAGNLGVIRVEADNYNISGNTVTGAAHFRSCYIGASVGVIGPNNFSAGTAGGTTAYVGGTAAWRTQPYPVQLPLDIPVLWPDTSGAPVTMAVLSGDNTFHFRGTTSTGAFREIFTIPMHSDVSGMSINITTNIGTGSTDSVRVTGGTGSVNVQANPNSGSANVLLSLFGKGNLGVQTSVTTSAVVPTVSTIGAGFAQLWKNTGDGTLKLYANDGGVLKSVTLA